MCWNTDYWLIIHSGTNILQAEVITRYQQNKQINSGGQQFHQYHQNKRKFKHQNK